ncbi:PspA-associated protein PspAB [Methanomethylovorans sp.]|uniref:PspA-associated protein PspAB n=2 Tax=Methanomethylovorans sp. TaxID=2758717 RepID=UPI002FDE118A
MGILDTILGRSKLPKAKTDRLFAISTASITLETNLGIKPATVAGICFKPIESSRYETARTEIEDLLRYSCQETGTSYRLKKDEYNFLWAILEDPDFEDIVTNIHLVSQTMIEHGFGEQLLCAIYKFQGNSTVYWIYNFKQDSFYPFVPKGNKERDNSTEFRLKSLMERELPIQKDVEKWYPLWGIPF